MPFKKKDIDRLLAATGRRCCLCGSLHNVQVHHIVPKEEGGANDYDNAIALCPTCHDRVHVRHSPGRTTRDYTPDELKLHRDRSLLVLTGETNKQTNKRQQQLGRGEHNTLNLVKVTLSDDAKKDCDLLGVDRDEPTAFLRREATSHPLMFGTSFLTMPFIEV